MVSARTRQGFTLVELVVVLAVVGILSAVAMPSFTQLVANQRLKSLSSDLFSSMMLARSEAIKRNTPVKIEPVAGGWSSGWRIPNPTQAGVYLDMHGPITKATITAPAGITFLANGRIEGNSVPTFDVAIAGTTNLRCVKTDLSGRPIITKEAC